MARFGEQLTLFQSGVSSTSRAALQEIVEDGSRGTMQERVFNVIQAHRGISRAEIVGCARMRLSSVCGRVNELLQIGRVVETAIKKDNMTGKSVKILVAVE